MTQLLALRAVVEATPDAVAGVLLDVRPGGRSPIVTRGELVDSDSDDVALVRSGSRFTVSVDPAARSVTEESEWWYRAVTAVEPDPRGSLVVHRIFSIASGPGGAVRFVARGPLAAAPDQFAGVVRRIGELLGVAARVLHD